MPLKAGTTDKVVGDNIKELSAHGTRPRSRAQIMAIAESMRAKSKGLLNSGSIGSEKGEKK